MMATNSKELNIDRNKKRVLIPLFIPLVSYNLKFGPSISIAKIVLLFFKILFSHYLLFRTYFAKSKSMWISYLDNLVKKCFLLQFFNY